MSIEKENSSYYDAEARVYDQNRYGDLHGQRVNAFHARALHELLFASLTPASNLLELGCGTARLTHLGPGAGHGVVGIDISQGMLGVARQRFENARDGAPGLVAGKLDALPFQSNTFDAAYAVLVLNLMSDLDVVLHQIYRVLRPGSTLVFNLPNLGSLYFPGGIYVNFRGKTVTRNEAGFRHSHWYTHRQVRRKLENAGFTLERVAGQPPWAGRSDNAQLLPGSGPRSLLAKSLFYQARKPA